MALAQRNHRAEFAKQHFSSNILVELDGDRARVRANLVVQIAPAHSTEAPKQTRTALAPTLGFTLGEVYDIECVRTPDGWRFSRVDTVPVWMWGERPATRRAEPSTP